MKSHPLLNETCIQRQLIGANAFSCLVMPNYTPFGWWECDLFWITKARFFREYEIKLTRSDFHADTKKYQTHYTSEPAFKCSRHQFPRHIPHCNYKHDRLEARCEKGPNHFSFVTPKGMLDISEIPEWAGLVEIEVMPHERGDYLRNEIVKKAPRLHSNKYSVEKCQTVHRKAYNRYQGMLESAHRKLINKLNQSIKP